MARKFLVLIVGCPSCGAKRGEDCRMTSPIISALGTKFPHKAREDAYEEHKKASTGRRA